MKLDYTIKSPEERRALVEKIVEETPDITPTYLEILADYLVLCMNKQEKKERMILTENRMATVNKRECSLEGLASQLDNGMYGLVTEDKGAILEPKISITQQDQDSIPYLKQLRDAINQWEGALQRASGKRAYLIKKALIEMRKDQYVIKQAYQKPIIPYKLTHSASPSHPSINDKSTLNSIDGISLMDPKVVSAILRNYTKLKAESRTDFDGDLWYLIQDFDKVYVEAMADRPTYRRVAELKIEKMKNVEIKQILLNEFGTTFSIEYISNLWRHKIPKHIALQAQENFLISEYQKNHYDMKQCSKCGQWKPAHTLFFAHNGSSKDSWYSICKKCRNKKGGYLRALL